MEHNWLLYIAAFATPFGISLVTTPFAKKIAVKLKAIDYPKARGMHKAPIPRMGGLAIVFGFMATMLILMPFINDLRTVKFLGFAVGAMIIVVLGMIDDVYSLRAKTKMAVQIIAALVVVLSGTRMNLAAWQITSFLSDIDAPISSAVTILWIVGLTNAVNLIDGVDGLAAGVSSIAALCLTALCIISGTQIAVVFAATLAGACLGFLPRNFSPAEIIMGDTGSTFLGYVLAVLSIMGVFKSYALLSIVIAVMALALPIFDTLFAMVRRAINGKPLMSADRGHLHHRLIDSGYSHKQAVVILYLLSAVSGIIAILLAVRDYRATITVIVSFLIIIMMIFVYRKRTNS